MRQPEEPKNFQLGLIGYPLGHSYSPRLHKAALAEAGLMGEYRLFPIAPDAMGQRKISDLIGQLRSANLQGLNVTIPHKQAVLAFVDDLSEVARSVGAANCLWEQNGRVKGDNTDVPGFLHDLQGLGLKTPGNAILLGAGGSARAVAFALASTGWNVTVLARREAQSAELVEALARVGDFGSRLSSGGMDTASLARSAGRCDLLVNATPLGMSPVTAGCAWPEHMPLPEGAAVYDLIYNPLETTLLRRAQAAGLRARNGAGMLISQAALAFQQWTGMPAPFEVMERAFYHPQKVGGQ